MRITADTRSVWSIGFAAGVFGGLVMVLIQGILRLGARVPMFPDLFADLATQAIPPAVFSKVLDTLLFGAKPLLFVSLVLVQIGVSGIVGIIFASRWGRDASDGRLTSWRGGALVGLAAWALTAIVLLPIAGQGMFGAATADGPVVLNLALIAEFLVFGLTIAASYRLLADDQGAAPVSEGARSPGRRRLIGGALAGSLAVLAAGTLYRIVNPGVFDAAATGTMPVASGSSPPTPMPSPNSVVSVTSPPTAAPAAPPAIASAAAPTTAVSNATKVAAAPDTATAPTVTTAPEWTIKGLAPEVTSTENFYAVSKNLFNDPTVDASKWTLQVLGEVANPYTLTYNKLLQLPPVERYQTLMCISNEVGGDLISNAKWRGTLLRDIIMAAQPKPGVVKVVFSASDGYQDSVTFDRAITAQNVLAHTMNGEPLIAKHGMPARLLIPGIYGMKNVKWITKIELVNTNFQGYWQTRGWSDEAFINTMSRIDVPVMGNDKLLAGKNEIAGVAFGGEKGIGLVEVSVDGGKNWQNAVLKEPTGTFSWRLWRYDWNAKPGNYVIVVRATNGNGELQAQALTDTLPNGATGWHSISATVA
jgi:DMSO/TMAO reductase YedYZ molybdopterin-dependent catalytic subunit